MKKTATTATTTNAAPKAAATKPATKGRFGKKAATGKPVANELDAALATLTNGKVANVVPMTTDRDLARATVADAVRAKAKAAKPAAEAKAEAKAAKAATPPEAIYSVRVKCWDRTTDKVLFRTNLRCTKEQALAVQAELSAEMAG